MNNDDDGDDYKVGPGNPPKEHRWKKGCPSPNPRGRPTKAQQRKMMEQRLEPFQQMVMRKAAVMTRTKSGEEISLQEAALHRAYELAFDPEKPSVRALALVMALNNQASAEHDKLRRDAATAAMRFKDEVGAQLRQLDAQRVKYVAPVPHPDDIFVGFDLSITFVGPRTAAEQLIMLSNLAKRDNIADGLAYLLSVEDKKAVAKSLMYLERQWKKLDNTLPPRLRKRWPVLPGQLSLDKPT